MSDTAEEKVFARLADETSRKIYRARREYARTQDFASLRPILEDLPEARAIYGLPKRKAYIFGGGTYGKRARQFIGMDWQGFIDNDSQKWGVDTWPASAVTRGTAQGGGGLSRE